MHQGCEGALVDAVVLSLLFVEVVPDLVDGPVAVLFELVSYLEVLSRVFFFLVCKVFQELHNWAVLLLIIAVILVLFYENQQFACLNVLISKSLLVVFILEFYTFLK